MIASAPRCSACTLLTGEVYHGAIQMLMEPTGRKMFGKWAGFGRDFDVNTGPWSLELITHDTSPEVMEKYNRLVTGKSPEGDDIEPDDSLCLAPLDV